MKNTNEYQDYFLGKKEPEKRGKLVTVVRIELNRYIVAEYNGTGIRIEYNPEIHSNLAVGDTILLKE